MATRLIGTDDAFPRLPQGVIDASQGTGHGDVAPGDVIVDANAYTDEQIAAAVLDPMTVAFADNAQTIAGTLTGVAVSPAGLAYERSYFDARSYGVVFDNATDNSTALQAALDAVAASGGTLVLPRGVALYASPLTLAGAKSVRIVGQGGAGQNAIPAATQLVYTGTTGARAIDVTGSRGVEFADMGLHHTSASFTGAIVDMSGTAAANSTRHCLRRVVFGSTSPTTVKSATGIIVDGCYDVSFEQPGFAGLVDGIKGQIPTGSGGQNFSNGITIRGGYGHLISGRHVINCGNGWSVFGYVAEPTAAGVPNFAFVPSTVVAASLTVEGCHFDDATASGAWIDMAGGSVVVTGGYFRLTGGSVVKVSALMDAVVVKGATVVGTAGQGAAVVNGGGFTSLVEVGPNRLVAMDLVTVNVPAGVAVVHAATGTTLPATFGTTAEFQTSLASSVVNVGAEFGGVNLLSADASSFEAAFAPWSNGANATVARSNAQALNGTWSLSLTSLAAGNMHATVAVASGFAVTAGLQYTFLASFRTAVTARSCRLELYFYNAGNTLLGAGTIGASVTDSTTGWTQALVTAYAPPGAVKAVPVMRVLATGAAGEAHYIDCCSLATGTSPIWHASATGPAFASWRSGVGSPEGVVAAPVGSLFSRTDGGAGTSLYVKQTGTGNTGWVGK